MLNISAYTHTAPRTWGATIVHATTTCGHALAAYTRAVVKAVLSDRLVLVYQDGHILSQ